MAPALASRNVRRQVRLLSVTVEPAWGEPSSSANLRRNTWSEVTHLPSQPSAVAAADGDLAAARDLEPLALDGREESLRAAAEARIIVKLDCDRVDPVEPRS